MGLKDIFSSLGGLEKLKITAFSDEAYQNAIKTYVVMYNPTAYSTEVKTRWIPEEGADPDGRYMQFRGNQSDTASFEFLFDATGASPPGEDTPGGDLDYLALNKSSISNDKVSAIEIINEDGHVDRAIREFINMAEIQGETHSPSHLQINWGAYEFRGVLSGVTVNYKLFNEAGLPIRATVSANFQQSIPREEQAAEVGRSSPDLTHSRIIKAGDTLPLMTERTYNDPKFYLEVARVNNLFNFRKLRRGGQLILPPIEK